MNKNNIDTQHFQNVQKQFSDNLKGVSSSSSVNHFETVQKLFEKKLKTEKIRIHTIGDVNSFLKSHEYTMPQFMDELPFNNTSDSFILHNDLKNSIKNLWEEFILSYVKQLSLTRKAVKDELLDKNGNLRVDTEAKEFIFMKHKDFHIINMSIHDFIKLTYMDVLSENKSYQIHRQNMYIGFLFYLHSKNLLLFPLQDIFNVYHKNKKAQAEIEMFLSENAIYQKYKDAEANNRLNTKELKEKRRLYFVLYTLSPQIKITDIKNSIIDNLRQYHKKSHRLIKLTLLKLGAPVSIENQDSQYTKQYNQYIEDNKYPTLIEIFNKYMNRKVKLKETKSPKQFYRKSSSIFVAFFKFLDKEHPNLKINIKNLERIFNYPDSRLYTYQEYVDNLLNKKGEPLGDSTKSSRIYPLLEVFSTTDGYERVLNKRKIIHYNTKSSGSAREAIDDEEVIFKLDDIVTNRPPKSDYFRNHTVDIDTSWWKHMEKVRPFEPLIIKLHLRIPARGETLRLIDRDNLLVLNHKNQITGFRFKSDKNKNRKTPFVVPNIWTNELNFLIHLIEYNRVYFPHLKKFIPDDITLKEGIYPLFPNDDGTASYKSSQHLIYWGKVLLQAEIEFIQEGHPRNLVTTTSIPIPKTIEEMEQLTQAQLDTFKKKYDIHTLRHTGISRYINMNMPLELVRMLSGHSGFNTILTIYHHLNHEKMIREWSSKHSLDIADELNMHERSNLFIRKKILEEIGSDNPQKLLKYLEEECFFNLENRSIGEHKDITLESISKTDPLFWRASHNHCGICTKKQCPQEFDGRCSLCPYFVTNHLYIEEIGIEMQLSMARCKKLSELVVKNREKGEREKNMELKQRLNLEIEDFAGWIEVLAHANTTYENSLAPNTTDDISSRLPEIISHEVEDSIFSLIPSVNLDHGYLDILSKTFLRNKLDNESVQDIIKIMSGKIIRYAAKNNSFKEIESFNDEQVIRWFLPRYERLPKDWHSNQQSRQALNKLLLILDPKNKNLLKGINNENTLLTK